MVRLYCFEIAPSIEAALSFLDSEGDKLHCKRKIITELKDLMEEKRLPVDAKVAGQDSKLDSGSSSINFIKYQTQRLNQFLENIPIPVKGAVSLILFAIGVVRMLKNKFGPIWLQIMKKRLITTLVQAARPRF